MLSKILSFITGAPVEAGVEFFKRKAELKQELKLKKLQGQLDEQDAKNAQAAKRAEHVQTWELAHLGQLGGYKDEFVLGVVSTPMIMGFIPGLSQYSLAGFEVLEKMPVWYQILVVTIFLAIYGIRAHQGKNIVGRILGKDK